MAFDAQSPGISSEDLETTPRVGKWRGVLALLGLLAGAICPVATADGAELKTIGDADVKFFAVGPAGLKINGTSASLSGSEQGQRLTLTAGLTNLKTGIG